MDHNKLAWKGTPGPWKVARGWRSDQDAYRVIAGENEYNVVICDQVIFPRVMNEANAHMAGTAPEMAEFIADLLEAEQKGRADLPVGFIELAEELLKKAYNF